MPSCRTSAAATTTSAPTSHRRSAWLQHSASSHWPCDLRFSRPDACPGTLDATDPLSSHSQAELDRVAAELNGRPRKTLKWRKPVEELDDLLAQHTSP